MKIIRAAMVFTFTGLVVSMFFINAHAKDTKKPVTHAVCDCPEQTLPLYEQSVSNIQILNWATEAATTAFTLDFKHFREQLQRASVFFTPEGWSKFTAGLQKSKNLATIQKHRLVGAAVPFDTPLIKWAGQTSGIFTWNIEVPLLVTYENSGSKFKEKLMVSMFVKRTSPYVGHNNIAIHSFTVSGLAN